MATDRAIRVSHAERNEAVEVVQAAFADGRLTADELDQRLAAALNARTRADLDVALHGLSTTPGDPPLADMATRLGLAEPSATSVSVARSPSGSDRMKALAVHWLGWMTAFIGPAIVAAKARPGSYVRDQAVEATNFQLTFVGACIAIGVVAGVTFGIGAVLFAPLVMVWWALTGIAGLAAGVGNRFRYPWIIRPIRP